MKYPYLDLHTHTNRSDGVLSPQTVVDLARDSGVGILAITDHNRTMDLTELRRDNLDIRLIQGAEVSCYYADTTGKRKDVHVVALGFDPGNEEMKALLARNCPDRRPYIEAILSRLRDNGIDVGTFEDIQRSAPESDHFGRLQVAKEMVRLGFVADTDEAYDEYLGAFGKRRAYVPNPLKYATLEEAVPVILAAGGVAVLAHLFYYQLSDEENHILVRKFKALAGDRGGMETEYASYTHEERTRLRREFAEVYDLMPSAASDFHDIEDGDTLANQFLQEDYGPLLEKLKGV